MGASRLGCAACLLFLACSASFAGMRVEPLVADVQVAPGGLHTVTYKVSAPNNVSINVEKLYWTFDQLRQQQRLSKTSPVACADWIEVDPKTLRNPLTGEATLTARIRVPEDAKGGCYLALAFAPEEEIGTIGQIQVKTVSILNLEVKGRISPSLEVQKFEISPPTASDPFKVVIEVKNTGDIRMAADPVINLLDPKGRNLAVIDPAVLRAMPGQTAVVESPWMGRLDSGDYTALLTLRLSGGRMMVKEFPVHIAGPDVARAVVPHKE